MTTVSKKNKKRSVAQERSIAKSVGGKTIPGSGALWTSKGDVRTNTFLIEAKTTRGKSFSVTTDVLSKIEREATKDGGRIPVLCVEIGEAKKRYAVLDLDDLLSLVGEDEE